MSTAYLGFGFSPRCPHCGGDSTAVVVERKAGTYRCRACRGEHERDEKGRLVMPNPRPPRTEDDMSR